MNLGLHRAITMLLEASALLSFAGIAKADSIIDTTVPGWTWSGMTSYSNTELRTGSGYAGGSGSYAVYTFKGVGVDVYTMSGPSVDIGGRGHKMGSIKVSIDGHVKAARMLSQPVFDYNTDAYTVTGLTDDNHVLEIDPQDGYAVISYIIVRTDIDADGGISVTGAGSGQGQDEAAMNVLFYSKLVGLNFQSNAVYRNNVVGFLANIGPELVDGALPGDWGPEQIHAHSGTSAIRYSGSSIGNGPSYCCMVAYSVHVDVDKDTVLQYWILPQQDNGRYVGVDLHCTDGTSLCNLGAQDVNGTPIAPAAGHGGGIPTYQWSLVKCRIGKYIAGKTVDSIWITYARNGCYGPFRGYIDDIVLGDQAAPRPNSAAPRVTASVANQ